MRFVNWLAGKAREAAAQRAEAAITAYARRWYDARRARS